MLLQATLWVVSMDLHSASQLAQGLNAVVLYRKTVHICHLTCCVASSGLADCQLQYIWQYP